MMGYGYDVGSNWMWGYGGLMMLGALALIGLAVWAFVAFTPGSQHAVADRGDRSRQILDERYARGELTTQEYTERERTLGL
jgi:putative membrane protein